MRKKTNTRTAGKSRRKTRVAHVVPAGAHFIDRDQSLLDFNTRVLYQAADTSVPLLERVRFLSIFQSNIDEFFMKRFNFTRSALINAIASNLDTSSLEAKIQQVRNHILDLWKQADEIYAKSIVPDLQKVGIHFLSLKDLSESERLQCQDVFEKKIFPILTPLAVDPAHPFPLISNLSNSLAVSLRYPGKDELVFSRLKIPRVFPTLMQLSGNSSLQGYRWINVREIITHNLSRLFPDLEVVSTMPFRIIRNIEVEFDEEDGQDRLELVAQELKERRFGEIVAFEHTPKVDSWLVEFLKNELELKPFDLFEKTQELDYTHLDSLYGLNLPEHKYSPWTPVAHEAINDEYPDIFSTIKRQDQLVHHPYENFTTTVERFIRQAADDPQVLAIKMTLYRTNEESTFVKSLIAAAESGKQVVCVVELKARFDEAKNITWATRMENAGVHVVYGIVGLKTHCKTALVVRQEEEGIQSYVHIGTGNYHGQTAKFYTDVGLFSADKEITEDIIELFHYLTGRSLKKDYRQLLVAPVRMKQRLLELIKEEEVNATKGLPSAIILKCNNLEDHDICEALLKASKAGVPIQLLVRSICTLRPKMKGLSENITITSTVDRFLEHSRIYYFRQGKPQPEEGTIYIGSADLMYRNLIHRVEVLTPILRPELKSRCYEILQVMINDQKQAWELQENGVYVKRKGATSSAQTQLMETAKKRSLPAI